VDKLDSEFHFLDLFVANISALAQEARAFLAEQQQQQQQQDQQQPPPARPPPGEGAWTHHDLVSNYLTAFHKMLEWSATYMLARHADPLWQQLVQDAPTRADMQRAVLFFKAGVNPREPLIENPEAAALLRRVPLLPAGSITKDVFHLTMAMFNHVRGREGRGVSGGRASAGAASATCRVRALPRGVATDAPTLEPTT
jgi:hypothetical protein